MLHRLVGTVLLGVLTVTALPGTPLFNQIYYETPEAGSSQLSQHVEHTTTSDVVNADIIEDYIRPRPPHPPHSPSSTNKTIFEAIEGNPRFSRLFRLLNTSDEIVSILNDSSANVTFFAIPNKAIPRRRRHGGHPKSDSDLDLLNNWSSSSMSLSSLVSQAESVNYYDSAPDKERKKEIFKKIVTAVLSYHILPQRLDSSALKENTTYATNLSNVHGALDGQSLRLHVGHKIPFGLSVNVYAKVIRANLGASNGIIHILNHPLVPPPSIFQQLFMFQRHFSTLSSAIQRVNLTDALEYRYVRSDVVRHASIVGTPATTLFAPSNVAFGRLPPRLRLFLFSPFGEKALKKLLQFHVVPSFILHSDWLHNMSSEATFEPLECEALSLHHQDELHRGLVSAFGDMDEDFDDEEGFVEKDQLETVPRQLFSGDGPKPAHEQHRKRPSDDGTHPSPSKRPRWPRPFPRTAPVYSVNVTLPTSLTNSSLSVQIVKHSLKLPIPGDQNRNIHYKTHIIVNGQPVGFSDGVASNGAVHVINRVLNPRPHGHPPRHGPHKPRVNSETVEKSTDDDEDAAEQDFDEDWEDWESWLPAWAEEEIV